ncbi:MAG: tRNA (N6-threonylcarbamoyladenosine(37)-N6)-methyltransferase TrmO [Candidatus Vecturithrix sp.]|jgi:tRNA-Thr(GGU) m(6)t(6)A37 methyltransferase TsaA|nr:tRNA (N6-threonylcarbamoyladenosine(37)-N6)-methyltransferase TrmO [Candidatus Vecturithrix sp.]
MQQQEIIYRPIGVIHSPHTIPSATPIQPVFSKGIRGTVVLEPEYVDGLLDLEEFSHIFLIYHFHRSPGMKLRLCPYLQDAEHGIFATRAPHRPNPIGFSVVKLCGIEGNILTIEDVDILDGTPLLDIKPYAARFDSREDVRSGWQEQVSETDAHIRGKRDYQKEKTPGSF